MIHHVEGTLAEKPAGRLVVDVGGVGLELHVSEETWREAGSPGEPVRLLAHLSVREDAWTLFGFGSEDERALFRLLLGVQGVGPRMALGILSGLASANLRRALQEGDVDALTAVSGVGKKTAERLVVDLRDKVGPLPARRSLVAAPGTVIEGDAAVDALVALGYPRSSAREAVRAARNAAPDGEVPVEVVVREALRHI